MIGLEYTFVNINAQSSLKLSEARGTIMAACGAYTEDIKQLAPNKIKKIVSGEGHADKKLIHESVCKLIKDVPKVSKDESDALSIAYACNDVFNK